MVVWQLRELTLIAARIILCGGILVVLLVAAMLWLVERGHVSN